MSILNDALRKRKDELNGIKKEVSLPDKKKQGKKHKIIFWGGALVILLLMMVPAGIYGWRYFHMEPSLTHTSEARVFPPQNDGNSNKVELAHVVPSPDLKKENSSATLNDPSTQRDNSKQVHVHNKKQKNTQVTTSLSKEKNRKRSKSFGTTKTRITPPGSETHKERKQTSLQSNMSTEVSTISELNEIIPKENKEKRLEVMVQKKVLDKGESMTAGLSEREEPLKEEEIGHLQEKIEKEESESVLKEEPEHVPVSGTEEPFYKKALSYHRLEKWEKAIEMYTEVLKKNPKHREAIFNLASAYIETSLFSKASPLLERLKNMYPDNPQVVLNLAIAEIGLGRSQSALSHLEKAESQKGPIFEIYLHRGVAYSQIGKLDDAILWYKKAEDICQDCPLLLFNTAVCYDKCKKYGEALKYYTKFVKQNPSSPDQLSETQRRISTLRAYLMRQTD